MRNRSCAVEIAREGCVAGGASTASCFRPLRRALLPWAAAAVVLLGGGLAAQAQSITPADKCAVSSTTVTCTGDLRRGVDVDGGSGLYTTLYVNTLDGNIAPAERDEGIEFTGDENITLDVNTGSYGIVTRDASGMKVVGNGGTTTVHMRGDIETWGDFARGIDLGNDSGNVEIYIAGDIETFGTERSGGINADGVEGYVKIEVTGNIVVRSGDGILAASATTGETVEVTVKGDITNWGTGNGINTSSDGGNITITLSGGAIASAAGHGIYFYNSGSSSDAENTLTINNTVTISGASGDVVGLVGDETIDNYGTLTTLGVIDLGEGDNRFNNKPGATFNSGTFVTLSHGTNGDDGNSADDVFTNAGDLSPGGASEMQTTELAGNFVNEQSGTYTVTIGSTAGANDKLSVTGIITLNGGRVRVVGAYVGRYKILQSNSGEIKGQGFDDVIDTLFMNYELDNEDSNIVWLNSTRNATSFLEATGVTGTANQRAVANALDSLDPTDPDNQDTNSPIARAFLDLNTAEEVRAAADAISGEVHASLKGALADTGQRRVAAVNRRLAVSSGNPDAQTSDAKASTAAFGNPSSLADRDSGEWIIGYGAWGETDATPGTARMETDLRGVLYGVDRALGDHWRLGVLGGYSRTDVTQRARLSSASVDTLSAGLYGGAAAGAWGLGFGAIHNWHAVDTGRTVSFTNYPPERLSARYDARSWQFFAEAGRKVQVGGLMLEPFAGVSHTNLTTDDFSESGGDAALTSSSDTDNTTFTTLGMHGAMVLLDTIHVRGTAGWRHAFGDTEPSSTATPRGTTAAFTVTGAPIAEDALVAEFGIEAGLTDNAFLGVAYKGRYSDAAADHGFNAGLRVTF